MFQKLRGLLYGIASFPFWFSKELSKAWGFGKVLEYMNPWQLDLIQYGIPLLFAGVCIWLLWIGNKPQLAEWWDKTVNQKLGKKSREVSRRRSIVMALRDKYYAEHYSPWPKEEEVLEWINSQLIATGEVFRVGPPAGTGGFLIPEERVHRFHTTAIKADGVNLDLEDVGFHGFDTAFDLKGGSLRGKHVEATAPKTPLLDKSKKK